jgi:hypothetical protein
MSRSITFALLVGIGLLAVASGTRLGAGDKKDKGPPEPPPAGPEHKVLKDLAGTFDARVTVFLAPGKNLESKGVMKRQMVLDGRFLHEEYDGSFADKLFKGIGLSGYDTIKKKYVSVWVDSMTNSIMASEGTYDEKTRSFHYAGEDVDASTGKKLKVRDLLKIVSPDEQTLEMFRQAAGGAEFKMMEIHYVRKK